MGQHSSSRSGHASSRRRAAASMGAIYDVITAVFLVASIGIISMTMLIISNPQAPFNPFPLAEVPTEYVLPSATATPTVTSTATVTATPLPSLTPTATVTTTPTVLPSITPSPVIPGAPTAVLPSATVNPDQPLTGDGVNAQPGVVLATPTPTATLSTFPFNGTVRYTRNENEQGCQWVSIAGTAIGQGGEPVTDLAVEINGNGVEAYVFTGSAPDFGFSGFEYQLGSTPFRARYRVRLIGPTGIPVSDFISVETGETCDRNITIVDFVQTRAY